MRFNLRVPLPLDPDALNPTQLKALVVQLLAEVAALRQMVAAQREEIARLKGLKGPPSIKPSGMERAATAPSSQPGGDKPSRGKVRPRISIEERIITATVPPGSRFKGYESFLVQDLVLSVQATRYRRERWVTPGGQTILASLPAGIDGHFGPDLRRLVLMLYHQGQTTLPRLTTLLRSVGVAISERQVQRLLTERQDEFLAENRDVLRAGLESAPWPTTPVPATRRPTAFARRSATTASPGLAHGPRRAG